MDKYIINNNTLAIYEKNNETIIIENYVTYHISKKALEVVNESCKYYGSSLKGRVESTNYLLGIVYKAPIIISEKLNIIFFPTLSINNVNSIWFNYHGIEKYFVDNNGNLNVFLKNGKDIKLDITSNIFNSQFLKSSRLDSILKNNCK